MEGIGFGEVPTGRQGDGVARAGQSANLGAVGDIAESGLELVVARYREDIAWTRNVPKGVRVSVYDKGGGHGLPDGIEAIPLANVGREAHTYLWHLTRRYDSLAPVTVFCQGHPFDHAHDLHRVLRAIASGVKCVQEFLWLGFIIDTDDRRGRRLFVPWGGNPGGRELPLDEVHEALLGEPCPERVRFYPGGQFAVTAGCARSRPREFFERALEMAAADDLRAHCFERLWDRVFGVCGVDEGCMGGSDTVYLKPIRRLMREGMPCRGSVF